MRKRGRRGNSIVEFTLLLPWYVFLFVGAYDFGIYSYSLIAEEEGVRVAALNASQNTTTAADASTACQFILDSMRNLPNIGAGVTTCGGASPLTVTAVLGTGPDSYNATTVTATYTTATVIAIPGILPGQLTIVRAVQMRVRT